MRDTALVFVTCAVVVTCLVLQAVVVTVVVRQRDELRRVLVEHKLAEWRGEPGQVPSEFHIIEDKEGK